MLKLRQARDPASRSTDASPNATANCGDAEETAENGDDELVVSLSAAPAEGVRGVLVAAHSIHVPS